METLGSLWSLRSISGTSGAGGQNGLVSGVGNEHGPRLTHSEKPEKHVQLACDSRFLRRKLFFPSKISDFHRQTIVCSQEVMHFVFL